ncbi:hypothetical protein G8764_20755 [Pseudomaricurvus alcaniphilus]|uniref:hypothetical protein n=1 Tax=Pseudomaricurvus alcaniphilus TaxID=1166482 RepID=UPI00140AC02F|nr:hypothetical protein [Pseudomaricurvus alcaniphilus]NHN39740.1 hypothetical protein [Pseudomaricurvus alcaniphilus]
MTDATVVQGNRVYARGIGYYTDNTIAPGGTTPTGMLRLVVTSSSHPVNNADGADDSGNPVFMLASVNDTTRIEFQMRRAAFAYTAELQQFVDDIAPVDSDGDGIPDNEDACPQDPDNDVDGDGVCGDVDECPLDADNDIDGDGICGDVDACPFDIDNDSDSDGSCDSEDACPNDPLDDVDGDGVCGDVDICPIDAADDSDNDGSCDSDDICPADPDNDIDGDGFCANEDICPTDPGNDSDEDGICFADDLCPDDPTNSCVTVNGQVFGNGSTIFAASVKIGTNTVETTTDEAGFFAAGVGNGEVASNGSGKFFPVKVKAPGFATGNAKVNIVPGQTDYEITVNLQQISQTLETDDDLNAGVEINSGGNPVGSLQIPDGSLPDGVTEISGNITYLDPATNDIIAGPDLLALPAGANPNDTPVTLETFGMMEFDLEDQDGNPISELGGPAEVCMKAPAGLAEGDTVPLWYYDEDAGLWKEEGEGTVEVRNSQLQICGEVTHFTWWNYDQPINTHSCFKFQMKDAISGTPLTGFSWYAEGVTYSGTSPSRFCTDNAIPESFDSLTVKKSPDVGAAEQIRVYTLVNSIKYYLHRFGDNDYRLLQSQAGATVFDTPRDQGSCLSGTQSGVCVPLDFMDASPDGMLSVSADINFPPVISQFTLSDLTVQLGATATAMATVTDPEGTDVSVAWETQCNFFGSSSGGSVSPTAGGPSASGTTFDTEFTAPSSLSSIFESCFVDITATDADGNSSTARRYLTVVGNSEFLFEGTLYGIDGEPLPGNNVRYFNFCDGDQIDLTVQTDSNGFFQIPVDLGNCGFLPGEFFYGNLGSLNVPYFNGPDFWDRWMEINSIFGYYGEFFGDFQNCNVEADGTTQCTVDVYLPTLWTPFSGNYHRTNEEAGIDQLIDFDHQGIYGGYFATDSFFDRADDPGSFPAPPVPFGPAEVPLGGAILTAYTETGPGSNSFVQSFGAFVLVPSLEPFSHDAADSPSVTVPTTVKVFDDVGDPQQGFFVDSFFDVFFSLNNIDPIENLVTDADGEVQFDSPLGPVFVDAASTENGFDFYGGGYARVPSVPLLIDLNSPDTCTVVGTAYDDFGQPLADSSFFYYFDNGVIFDSVEVNTDSDGAFSFNVAPGQLYIDSYFGGEFGFGSDFIDNCRNNRVIRRDLRLVEDFFFGQEF